MRGVTTTSNRFVILNALRGPLMQSVWPTGIKLKFD
jgi:hypothetical protein